ncbi:MAG: PEPxxWA-CTERM sorting domain-containing protein [Thermaurantiacus sp.]
MKPTFACSFTMAAALVAAAPALATTTLLDFDASEACMGPCTNGSQIRQSYGDTAEVDVVYRLREGLGDTPQVAGGLFWWGPSFFGDLNSAVWGSGTTEIRFELEVPGKMITLDSFDMARFTGTTLTELRVYDVDWTLLWSATDQLAPIGGRLSYAPGVSSTSGLILQHGSDTANRGLGNIRFTVSDLVDPPVVPEPASWAMLIMGFGLVGAAARRRLERTPA